MVVVVVAEEAVGVVALLLDPGPQQVVPQVYVRVRLRVRILVVLAACLLRAGVVQGVVVGSRAGQRLRLVGRRRVESRVGALVGGGGGRGGEGEGAGLRAAQAPLTDAWGKGGGLEHRGEGSDRDTLVLAVI